MPTVQFSKELGSELIKLHIKHSSKDLRNMEDGEQFLSKCSTNLNNAYGFLSGFVIVIAITIYLVR